MKTVGELKKVLRKRGITAGKNRRFKKKTGAGK